jgi:beta-lactamase regulating signal transducer with metallopeptidase domain
MTALLIAIVVKGSILMTAAAVLVVLMYRASAATRHFVWALAVVGLLVLPAFSIMLPTWEIDMPVAPHETTTPIDAAVEVRTTLANAAATSAPDAPRLTEKPSSGSLADEVPWAALPAVIYVLGVLILVGRLLVQRSAARRIVGEAASVSGVEWVSLLNECAAHIGIRRAVALRRSREQLMPLTVGTITPTIVIPAVADAWNDDRRRAVLLHELAHIARYDCLTQMLAAIACSLYWFHPGVWYVARRLRIEREVACDDRVLAAGAVARDYAGHLLELAYNWSGRRAPALAVGIASSRKLEGRIRAVLDGERNRTAPTRRAWLVGVVLGAAVLLPIAALTTTTTTTVSADGMDDSLDARAPQAERRSADEQDATSGTWELQPTRTPNRVRLRLRIGTSSFNSDVDVSTLEDFLPLPLANLNDRITFKIAREAGVFEIDGTIKSGAGSGSFRFVPSEAFMAGLTRRGFPLPRASQLMALAERDLGFAFIDELAAQKYARPDMSELVRAAHHGVDLDFVKGMSQAGYRVGTLDALIRFRDHGVTPEFVRELRAQGVSDLSPEELVRARDHGIDAEYVRGMRQAGYRAPISDLIRARDHGVDPEYVDVLRKSGHTSLGLDEVIRARDHGVDADYLRDMRELGYTLMLAELINARDHGVTPDYIVALAVNGYKGLPIETLIRLRDHGVTPEYVLNLKKRGIDNPSVDELIRLRDRGAVGYKQDIALALARLREHFDHLVRALNETAAAVDAR